MDYFNLLVVVNVSVGVFQAYALHELSGREDPQPGPLSLSAIYYLNEGILVTEF